MSEPWSGLVDVDRVASPGVSRRDVATAFLGVLGASQGPVPAASGSHLKWVDSVLGAAPPAPRTGDLARSNAAQLGASLVVARGAVTPGDGGGGMFYWDTSSSVDDGGTTIRPTEGGGVWRRIFGEALSVRWFGATASGSSSDVVAIQNAIDACPPSGGVVFFPPGRYRTSSPIHVRRSNVVLQGSGGALDPDPARNGRNGSVIAAVGNFDTLVFRSAAASWIYGNRILDLLLDETGKTGGRTIYGEKVAQFNAQRVSAEGGHNGIEFNQFNILLLSEIHLVYYRGASGSAYLRLTSGSGSADRGDVAWIRDCIFSTDSGGRSPGMKGVDIDGFVHTVNLTRIGVGNSGAEALLVRNAVGASQAPAFVTAYDLEIEFPQLECIRLDAGAKLSFTGSVLHGSLSRDNVYVGGACANADFTGGCSTGAWRSGIAIAGKDVTVTSMRFSENNQMGPNAPYPGILIGGTASGVVVSGCRSGEPHPGGVQRYGLQIDTGAEGFCVTGNTLTNNRLGPWISGAAVGTPTKIVGNNAG
jgi:hypothetical protein